MKKKLEAWLRRIIAKEVNAVSVTLDGERSKITSTVSAHAAETIADIAVHAKATTTGIEQEVLRLMGEFEGKLRADMAAIIADKNQLITELTAKIADMQQTLTKFTTWKADADTVAADHELRKVR